MKNGFTFKYLIKFITVKLKNHTIALETKQ